MLKKIAKLLKLLIRLNIVKTIYFNFKKLPSRLAIKLPIYIYGKAKFRELNGSIQINAPIKRGMIKIGKNDYYIRTSVPMTYWVINGKIIFNGTAKFLNGGYMCVASNGVLTIGDDALIGSNYKIMCFESISIGRSLRCTYDCQIYDTSYHYVERGDGSTNKLTVPICIGDYVWIGNSSTIAKGSNIPSQNIIANRSFVNKDFEDSCREGGYLLAGSPAKVKASGMKRIFDSNREKELDQIYGYSRTHL